MAEIPGSFGDWLKARRKVLDLTQEELAKRAGCSIFALRKIESGERRPSKQLAALLAESLLVPEAEKQTFVRIARGELTFERFQAPNRDLTLALPGSVGSAQPHVPVPATPLLGRDAELLALERLFKDSQCRLLTLTGMGGIGKTRLAIEFALYQRDVFQGGVYFVPLASLNSAERVAPAIAEALGFTFSGPGDPQEQLVNYIASQDNKSILLVLDNLEQLLISSMSTVDLLAKILQQLPAIKILTTSRERLNMQGEWVYELYGLPVPALEFTDNIENYSAAELFLQAAKRTKADFKAVDEEQAALVRICRLLEGIPLAIELAAAWVGVLSLQEIASEIEANIDFLKSSKRDVPERHTSLRASFNHSWQLLSKTERTSLCRLAVFQGGFDRAAAKQVAEVDLVLLASLISKSLVRRAEEGRYDLHEVIRQFALSYLSQDPPQMRAACNAHSEYYHTFAAEREKALRSALQDQAMRELLSELDNLYAAWVWAIRQEEFSLVGASIRSLAWFFEVSGLIREGISHFEPLVRVLKAKHPHHEWHWVLGQALSQQGLLCFRKGLLDHAQELMIESLSLLRPLGRQNLLVDPLIYLGILKHLNGEIGASKCLLEEGLHYARSSGDGWFTAYAIYNLGYLDGLLGNYEEGYGPMIEGLAMFRALGDRHSISIALNYLIPTLIHLKYYEEARSYLLESLNLCEQTKNRWGMGTAYRFLGLVTLAEEQYIEAQAHFRKSLEIFGDYIVGWDIARSLSYLGDALLRSGSLIESRQIYSEALHVAKAAKSVPLMLDVLTGLSELELKNGQIEKAFEFTSLILKQPVITKDVQDRALCIRRQAEKCLDSQRIRIITEKASGETFEAILISFE